MFEYNINKDYKFAKETMFDLVKTIKRDGIVPFTNWLFIETDFLTAPASTKYHGACKGGLLFHSLNVYKNLLDIAKYSVEDSDTIKIVALFHDVCKTDFYKESTRNVKNDTTGKWEKVPYYIVDERFPYGSHGGKSVYLIMKHGLKITDEEAIAINNHMGGWDVTNYHNPSKAFEENSIALYLHLADMLATYSEE